MPAPALLLLTAAMLPLAAFLVLTFAGRRLGAPVAGWFGTAAAAGGFLCSMMAMVAWYRFVPTGAAGAQQWGYEKFPISLTYRWIPIGLTTSANDTGVSTANGIGQDHPGWLDVGLHVDSLTIAMFAMITTVALLVHVFSVGYMRGDKRFARFFTHLSLFCFAMLGLVLGGTLIHLFVFWELVGLCSYLLIGFWNERRAVNNAAVKAFVINRIGDAGFLIGFGILFYHLGNATLGQTWLALGEAGRGGDVMLADGVVFGAGLLTVMGVGLFLGAVGKSAQFPLHVWLPDAMEGPTPVSALIHAATMVAAGVYLVGRIFPILTPDAKLYIAITGLITLTMAALIALVQSDIKRVLAYSTISQLGYMIMALGIGSWVGALFHLVTHAFFKALLFLGAGSVIHAAGHEQEMPQFGGLIRKIPVTAITFAIAVLAISGAGIVGVGGLSGFYSKDMILSHAGGFAALAQGQGLSKYYWAFFVIPAGVACLTAFYMTRCWTLTFWGKPRNVKLYGRAHESPILWAPLVALAIASIIGGWKVMSVADLLRGSILESQHHVQDLATRSPFHRTRTTIDPFARAWPAALPASAEHAEKNPGDPEALPERAEPPVLTPSQQAHAHGERLVHKWVAPAFVVGIGLAFLMYMRGYAVARRLLRVPPLRWVHNWLYRAMYIDELYLATLVGLTLFLSRLSAWFDRHIVDGVVRLTGGAVARLAQAVGLHDRYVVDGAVGGVARFAQGIGEAARTPQTGRIRLYVTLLAGAITLVLAAAIVVMVIR